MSKDKWVLGLTGGIGTGKSAVSAQLARLGAVIVDADVIARELVAPKSFGLEQIVAHFGKEILHGEDGSLDRELLRKKVFSDNRAKEFLDNLLHPLIRAEILRQIDNAPKDSVVVLVAPLLFENKLEKYTDYILCMYVSKEVQIERTMYRDKCSYEIASKIISSQLDTSKKIAASDEVLESNFPTLEALNDYVSELYKKFVALKDKHLGK